VVKVNGENVEGWKDKRVCFIKPGGTWCQYVALDPSTAIAFEIDKDVDLPSAASGIVNPLTVIGMTHIFNSTKDKKGIIHTAAASALGRMLNKRCQTLGIPLLNVVRKEEQAELLKK
jgi:NADPH:quinone reductase